MGSQKRKKKKYQLGYNDYSYKKPEKGFDEWLDDPRFKPLRQLPSYVGYREDVGKEVYSYSNCRTWIDFSEGQKRQIRRSLQGIVLAVFACILIAWFLTSFIYRMVTEEAQGQVVLSMLPSLIIVAVCSAILLISYFGAWGGFVRWGYRHNLVHGRDAADRAQHKKMKEELDRADMYKYIECSVTVTEKYVILTMYGQKYIFNREAVYVKMGKATELNLTFTIDGFEFDFPYIVPEKNFVGLRKAFHDKFSVNKSGEKKDEEKTFLSILSDNIGFALVGICFFAVSVLLIVASYLWLPIPAFLGAFFLIASGFIFCNIFSDIPIVGEVGCQLVFTVFALVMPPWAYIWIETELMGAQLTFLYVLTHCSPLAAGFGFFWFLGFYALSYVISKIVDYKRFKSV